MDFLTVFNSTIFAWVILPILIFFSRIVDVSIGTIRLIYVSKGLKHIAPILGFFEVVIWLVAVSQIMKHLDNVLCYLAYGAGFAMGNYVGIYLEEKMSIGTVLIRIIPRKSITELIKCLREKNVGVTAVDAEGMNGPVQMCFTIVKRKDLPEILAAIKHFNPNEFYTIEDIKSVNEGIFRASNKSREGFALLNPIYRKGK